MTFRLGMRLLVPLTFVPSLGACRDYPTTPVNWLTNHQPVISSMSAFPEVIGQGDSILVTVLASDDDGDTLYYHWNTDARLSIKPNPGPRDPYYRPNPAQVFYRSAVIPFDSIAWVSCELSDRRGGSAYRHVSIRLRS